MGSVTIFTSPLEHLLKRLIDLYRLLGLRAGEQERRVLLRQEHAMPRFHFNIRDGKEVLDREGIELEDLQAARGHGIRCAGNAIAQEMNDLSSEENWRLEVTDSSGLVMFRMDFMVTESAASARQ